MTECKHSDYCPTIKTIQDFIEMWPNYTAEPYRKTKAELEKFVCNDDPEICETYRHLEREVKEMTQHQFSKALLKIEEMKRREND